MLRQLRASRKKIGSGTLIHTLLNSVIPSAVAAVALSLLLPTLRVIATMILNDQHRGATGFAMNRRGLPERLLSIQFWVLGNCAVSLIFVCQPTTRENVKTP